jgi:hypothetical protein
MELHTVLLSTKGIMLSGVESVGVNSEVKLLSTRHAASMKSLWLVGRVGT